MKEIDLRKADAYFKAEYGEIYTNRGHLMSFGYSTLPRIIQYSPKISAEAKLCYTAITDMVHNNDEPIAWMYYPSQKRIALLTGLSRKVVSRAMNKLVNEGLIGKKRLGMGRQNIYCLLKPPNKFIDEAIRTRVIIRLIKEGKMSWDDIGDYNNILNEEIKVKVDTFIGAFDLQSNPQTHVESQMSQNGTSRCPKTDHHDVPEMGQELTSVDITSDDVVSSSVINGDIESNGTFCDFSEKSKNHDASQNSDFSDFKESRITRLPKPKEKFVSYKRQLQPKELEAFNLVADSMENVVGKTLMELVKQSPGSVYAAHAETVERGITHFSYFTKVFFSHLKKENGNGKQTVGTFVDYDDIDEGLYL